MDVAEEFRHNREGERFELWVDGDLAGYIDYTVEGDVASFNHTIVAKEFGGRGIGGRLVQQTLDAVRADGQWKVHPVCHFFAGWMAKHPEYDDLLAG